MNNLPISRFISRFKALEFIQLPAYAGSTLRGAFGHALKNISCLTSARNKGVCCCQSAHICLYRGLFDPYRQHLQLQSRLQDIPPPFVIEAHSLPEQLEKGQHAHFFMTLVGEFAHSQQMIIQLAWQRALAVGLGMKPAVGCIQSELLSFVQCDQPSLDFSPKHKVRIQLISHARIQHHGHFLTVNNFDPRLFCHSVVRRYITLIEAYGAASLPAETLAQLYTDMQKVHGKANLEWREWSRWSSRQKQKMTMDGLLGTIELDDISDTLCQYLYWGQWLHVGKGSAFGLGQYIMT